MDVQSGWVWPGNAAKAHFFTTTHRSLCGRWLIAGEREPDSGSGSEQDCMACTRKAIAGGHITRKVVG